MILFWHSMAHSINQLCQLDLHKIPASMALFQQVHDLYGNFLLFCLFHTLEKYIKILAESFCNGLSTLSKELTLLYLSFIKMDYLGVLGFQMNNFLIRLSLILSSKVFKLLHFILQLVLEASFQSTQTNIFPFQRKKKMQPQDHKTGNNTSPGTNSFCITLLLGSNLT